MRLLLGIFIVLFLMVDDESKAQQESILGVSLGSIHNRTIDKGTIGGTDVITYFIKNNDNIINKIVIIPSVDGVPGFITDEAYNKLLFAVSDKFNISKPSFFAGVEQTTLIFNKIDYEVMIKIKSYGDLNNILIIIKSL